MNNYVWSRLRAEDSRARKRSLVIFTLGLCVALIGLPARATSITRSGQSVVASVCSKCHATGVDGAPKIGDRKAWGQRATLGLSSLTLHALQGIRKMPAHGGNGYLSDLEIARAITYMVNRSGGHWIEPASAGDLASERSGKQVVKAQCSKCHAEGLAGAPRIGDRQAWVQRLKHGFEYAVRSAIRGHGGMPPRGGQANLTDTELRSAILYMFYPAAAAVKPTPGAALATAMATPGADQNANHQSVDGIEIYLGFISAQKLLEFPKGSPERHMHGGVPKGSGYYHVNVTLYDEKSHKPIQGAHLQMKYVRPGLSSDVIELEPMGFGTGSYGNYIRTQPQSQYRITLNILRPGAIRTADAVFEGRYFK